LLLVPAAATTGVAGTGGRSVPSSCSERIGATRWDGVKIGQAGDRLSLARVFGVMLAGGILLGLVGYLLDLIVGPMISMNGWWTVFASGGVIIGAMIQCTREYAVPQPAERRAVEAEVRAREQASAPAE
jgi:hypothetical protein